jgi:hypothetical protein
LTPVAAGVVVAGMTLTLLSTIAALVYHSRVRLPSVERRGTVTLIMALTAASPARLGALMEALNRQTLPPRRLLIAVESRRDPAWESAMQMCAVPWKYDVEVIIAGCSVRCGQKSWNLAKACQRIDDHDEAVVFLDADVLPMRWWLSALVSPLLTGDADLVTGYRWPIPDQWTVGSLLVTAIDRTIAILPRPRPAALAWGGSLAISRGAYGLLSLERILERGLSDDLAIAAAASVQGLRTLNRRALLVPTPTCHGVASAWAFARRQYSIIRLYRPRLWYLALSTMSTLLVSWGIIFSYLRESVLAISALSSMVTLALIKVWALDRIAARLGSRDSDGTRLFLAGLSLIKPLVDAFHFCAVVASCSPRVLTWGHVTYRIEKPHSIAVLGRRAWPDC